MKLSRRQIKQLIIEELSKLNEAAPYWSDDLVKNVQSALKGVIPAAVYQVSEDDVKPFLSSLGQSYQLGVGELSKVAPGQDSTAQSARKAKRRARKKS